MQRNAVKDVAFAIVSVKGVNLHQRLG